MEVEKPVGSLARGLCGCIKLLHCESVTITENSTTFQALLSFIYPDKIPTIFTNLTSLMPVLDAAAKYDMKGIVQLLSLQLMKGTTGDSLIYEDPLWVYSKAKQLDLTHIARAAANATLTIDLGKAPTRPEVTNVPALWILELVKLRTEHIQWWKDECRQPIPIAQMSHQYEPTPNFNPFYQQTPCQCPQLSSAREIKPPVDVVLRVMEPPCARSVREIDFNQIAQCLRCGAATAAHYRKNACFMKRSLGSFKQMNQTRFS
jgi:hypothetical protein